MQTGWENLANRIILQAVKDYRRARIILGGKPGKSGKPKKSGEPAKKYARSTVLGVERCVGVGSDEINRLGFEISTDFHKFRRISTDFHKFRKISTDFHLFLMTEL